MHQEYIRTFMHLPACFLDQSGRLNFLPHTLSNVYIKHTQKQHACMCACVGGNGTASGVHDPRHRLLPPPQASLNRSVFSLQGVISYN